MCVFVQFVIHIFFLNIASLLKNYLILSGLGIKVDYAEYVNRLTLSLIWVVVRLLV